MDTRKNSNWLVTKRAQYFFVVLCSGAFLAVAMQGIFSYFVSYTSSQSKEKQIVVEEIRAEPLVNPFQNITLMARAVYVANLSTGEVIYSKNENEKLPLASITKLMTAFVAREQMNESVILTVLPDDLLAEGDSGLHAGERWRLGDILSMMLLVSSNDSARAVATFVGSSGQVDAIQSKALAREHFIQKMNETATSLKLPSMQFFNESGLDVSPTQNGGYGSAKDVAVLFTQIWKKYPGIVEPTSKREMKIKSQDRLVHNLVNTNDIVGHIPGLIASKTGFTDLSGGNLAVIFDKGVGDVYVAVVLGSGYKERFYDMQKLVSSVVER